MVDEPHYLYDQGVHEMEKLEDENILLKAQLQQIESKVVETENDYQAMRTYRANHYLKRKEAEKKLAEFTNPDNWTVHTIQGKKVYGFNKPELLNGRLN